MEWLNKVMLGDCIAGLKQIPDESVDCVITDPPFGISYQNHNKKSKLTPMLAGDVGSFDYAELAEQCFRILRNDTAFFCFTGWSVYPKHFRQVERAGFLMKEPLMAGRNPSGTGNLEGTFSSVTDWIIFGHKGRFKFRSTQLLRNSTAASCRVGLWKTRFPAVWMGSDYPYSSLPAAQNHTEHPTPKNPQFLKWLILLCTDPGQVVLDPFAGTGSTLVAARELGRRYCGFELEEKFYRICRRSLNTSLGFGALK